MAKKTRKQKQRVAPRRPQAAAPTPTTRPTAAAAAPAAAATPSTMRSDPAQILPETVLPLPGSGGEIESEPDAVAEEDAAVADGSSRRRVQRINPAAQPRSSGRQVSTAAIFLPLDSDDAAIPFDRVPYVPRDLRRVAIMASFMIVLILIAAIIVTRINP